MDKRADFSRRSDQALRGYIAETVSDAVAEVRGEDINELLSLASVQNVSVSQVEEGRFAGELLTDELMRRFLDRMYLDHTLLYGDLFDLQESLDRMKRLFDSTILSVARRTGELLSRSRDILELSGHQYDFTDTVHESFNSARNLSVNQNRLQINAGAGIVKLGAIEDNACTIAESDVFMTPVTSSVGIVDSSDPANAYNNDPISPYYMNLVTRFNPENENKPILALSGYKGVIVDLTVRFASTRPVTCVRFTPFSNAPVEIIGVYYSEVTNPSWTGIEMFEAEVESMSTDNPEIEINFPQVFAREVHVLIHQPNYRTARSDVTVNTAKTVDGYIDEAADAFRRALPDGFVETELITSQVTEFTGAVTTEAEDQVEVIPAGSRSYVIGVYGLRVLDSLYQAGGDYKSDTMQLAGNLLNMAITYDGVPTKYDSSGEVHSSTLFSIETGSHDIYLVKNHDGSVIDIAALEQNVQYDEGDLVQDPEYHYRFSTHFIPEPSALDEIRIGIDGREMYIPSGSIVSELEQGVEVQLPTSFTNEENMFGGSIVTLRYSLAEYDRYGRDYDPSSVDIPYRVGKPNINDNRLMHFSSLYLYVPEDDGFISYGPNEYFPVSMSGEPYFNLSSGKGENADGDNLIVVGSTLMAKERFAVGIMEDFYYGVMNEPVTCSGDTGEGVPGSTEFPYIKGTLKLFRGDAFIPVASEYPVDDITDPEIGILTNEEKRAFTVGYAYSGELTACYIPIDSTEANRYTDTNIARHNHTERFTRTVNRKIELARYPFIDRAITSADSWDSANGVFSLKYKYSVTYEPLIVYVNGVKATNITDFDSGNTPAFRTKRRETDYQYYIDGGNSLVFNEDLTGSIMVYCYVLSDTMTVRMQMMKSNTLRNDITPEIYNYTVLANVQR